jgi:hypothetical protein
MAAERQGGPWDSVAKRSSDQRVARLQQLRSAATHSDATCLHPTSVKATDICTNLSTHGSLATSKMSFPRFCLPDKSDRVSPKHKMFHKLFPFSKGQIPQMRHSSNKRYKINKYATHCKIILKLIEYRVMTRSTITAPSRSL